MVLIKEFRIVMPFGLSDYKRGARYSTARINSEVTNGSEGIEIVEEKEWIDEANGGKVGRYTRKIYHLASRVPGWVKMIAPASVLLLEEESWDCFPNSKTIITNKFFGDRFAFNIVSHNVDQDQGNLENACNLSEEELKNRVIHRLDIAMEQISDKNEYKKDEDPTLFKSKLFPELYPALTDGWMQQLFSGEYPNNPANYGATSSESSQKKSKRTKTESADSYSVASGAKSSKYMCAYKCVTVQFKIWLCQTKGESYLINLETDIFRKFHKEIFCWLDEWFGLTFEQVLEAERGFINRMKSTFSSNGDTASSSAASTDSSGNDQSGQSGSSSSSPDPEQSQQSGTTTEESNTPTTELKASKTKKKKSKTTDSDKTEKGELSL